MNVTPLALETYEARKTQQYMKIVSENLRDVPDYPKPGIVFKDITPLLAHPEGIQASVHLLGDRYNTETAQNYKVDKVVGMESRGFIFGAPLAMEIRAGFVPARKPGKLPCAVDSVSYDLEYGSATLEIHKGSIAPGERVLIVDDVLATGGTAEAAGKLVELQGGIVVGFAFLIQIYALRGLERLANRWPSAHFTCVVMA